MPRNPDEQLTPAQLAHGDVEAGQRAASEVSRRSFLGSGLAVGGSVGLAAVVGSATRAAAASTRSVVSLRAGRPIDLGSRLELMAGTDVVDTLHNSRFRLHPPVRRGVAMTAD